MPQSRRSRLLPGRARLPSGCWRTCAPARPFHWDRRGRAPPAYRPVRRCSYGRSCMTTGGVRALPGHLPAAPLAPPSAGFRCCAAPGTHVALAVALQPAWAFCAASCAPCATSRPGARLLDRRLQPRGGWWHGAARGLRAGAPECLFLLLGHAALAGLRDGGGLTPLRAAAAPAGPRPPGAAAPAASEGARAAQRGSASARLLLLDLLGAVPRRGRRRPGRRELLGGRPRSGGCLGGGIPVAGGPRAPPSLFARAMQVLVTAISPGRFLRPWMSCRCRPSCSRWTSRARARALRPWTFGAACF